MKVQELIKILETYDPDLSVYIDIDTSENDSYRKVKTVYKFTEVTEDNYTRIVIKADFR